MNKDELFQVFHEMFPDYAKNVTSYKKTGSRTLAVKFKQEVDDQKETEVSRVFLYINPNNWQFGTKLWRKKPEHLKKKEHVVPEGTKLIGDALTKYGSSS